MERRNDLTIGPTGVEVVRRRVREARELGGLRRVIGALLASHGASAAITTDVQIAVSELVTNAIAASNGEWPVEVTIRVELDGDERKLVATIDNAGEPYPGTLDVSPHIVAPVDRRDGRGLMVAARLGAVRLEGRIGGTRATFRRSL